MTHVSDEQARRAGQPDRPGRADPAEPTQYPTQPAPTVPEQPSKEGESEETDPAEAKNLNWPDKPDPWRGFGRPAEGQPDTETYNATQVPAGAVSGPSK